MKKLLVIGFDGATFDLIEPFVKKGVLPHFSRVLAGGASAQLQSVIPPVSAPAWVSMVTGKNPGKHNIYGFQDGKGNMVNSTFRKSKAVWNILDEHGKRSIIVKVPVTNPPEPINGVITSEILTPDERGFSGRFQIDKESFMEKEKALPKMFQWELSQTEKALAMMKGEWDLFFIVYHLSDFVPTIYWKYMDKTHPQYTGGGPLSSAIEEAYTVLDTILGQFLSAIDEDTCVVVVSDHGLGPSKKVFNINEWLRREGFLAVKSVSFEKTLSPEKVAKLLENPFINALVKVIPDIFQKKAYKKVFARSKDIISRIDPQTTAAYAFSHAHFASVWLLKKDEYILSDIEQKIKKVKDPDTKENIITRVLRRDHIFYGDWVENAPDLVVEAVPHCSIRSQRIGNVFSQSLQSGDHRMNGIFIAYGPGIKKGRIDQISIFDVCPTLLAMLGLDIPADMDGNVITELFKEGITIKEAEASQREIHQNVYTEKEEETLKNRLSALGYFD
jgi:predicted AlkP superfamily phosphohydrolase/phosphomutase